MKKKISSYEKKIAELEDLNRILSKQLEISKNVTRNLDEEIQNKKRKFDSISEENYNIMMDFIMKNLLQNFE